MSGFERFLAGDDGLARLIRAQAAFAPSAEQEARLLASLQQLAQEQAALSFEPPASLEANFLALSRDIQQAQAPRRDALLDRLQRGESGEQVLGHAVSPATHDWLRTQSPSPPAAAARPRRRWFQATGLVLASALVAALGVQLLTPARRHALPLSASAPAQAPSTLSATPESLPAAPPLQLARQLSPAASQVAVRPRPASQAAPASAPAAPLQLARLEPPPPPAQEALQPSPTPARLLSKAAPPPELAAERSAQPPPAPAPRLLMRKAEVPAPKIYHFTLNDPPEKVASQLAPGPWVLELAPPSAAQQEWLARLRAALPAEIQLQVEIRNELSAEQLRLRRP